MSEPEEAAILIKKYANRRLYHTERSEYVTLEDLSAMVRAGQNFVVQDAKSGEDITRSVLTQIIFDAENSGNMMLPTSFLREIIRLYGDAMQSMVPNYLEHAMSNFLAHQDELRASFAKNPALAGFEHISKLNKDWIEQSLKMFEAMNPISNLNPMTNLNAMANLNPMMNRSSKNSQSGTELDELKSQLMEMQEKLSKLVDR